MKSKIKKINKMKEIKLQYRRSNYKINEVIRFFANDPFFERQQKKIKTAYFVSYFLIANFPLKML